MTEPIAAVPDKAALRAGALARRDGLDPVFRAAASERIAGRGAAVLSQLTPASVSGYWPIRSEADPRPLLSRARAMGARIALPVTDGAGGLRFRLWDEEAPLTPAGFGTLGPPVSSEELAPDAIVLPLAGFDRSGHRLGYGKGHYDFTIARLGQAGKRPWLIGIGFRLQEVEPIPAEAHDVALDWIVTEDETLAFRREHG